MSTVPQTTDQKIDAALEPEIIVQNDGDGMYTLISIVSTFPEVHVTSTEWRDEEGTLTRVTPWTVTVPYPSQVLDAEGDFESAAAARNFAAILEEASRRADRLRLIPHPHDEPECPSWCETPDHEWHLSASESNPVAYREHAGTRGDGEKVYQYDFSDGKRIWVSSGEVTGR